MHPRHWKHHHHHHWDDGMRRGWMLRWRLQRRIFFTLASAILITVVAGAIVLHSLGFAVHKPTSHVAFGVFVTFFILWTFSRFMARRIASPMSEIERVARDIGAGNIHSRITIDRRMRMGEFPVLAHALNDMAERLEKQLSDQRALLATVSHEIRTPLARMRLLVEFARDEADEKRRAGQLDELDKEVVGVDALVSELLAASRIDFGALRRTELIAYDVAKQALERVGPADAKLDDQSEGATFLGDATLVARAVGNLLENAKRHAGGAARMRILERGPRIAFEVEDDGPGFSPGEETQIFQPFYRGKNVEGSAEGGTSQTRNAANNSVGLGLALVKRIAEAHGGRAYAKNREGGGALVGIELARA